MNTKVKRRKINVARILVFILFVYLIVCLVMHVLKYPVKHYNITGNSYLSDVDVLRSANLTDYPPFFSIGLKSTSDKLKSNPFIIDAKVSYGFNLTLNIDIKENKPVLLIKSTNQILLSDGTKIDNDESITGIPMLLNNTPDEILKNLASSLSNVDDGILYMISEIEYNPSYNSNKQVIDPNRFLLSMSDKNLVFITAKKATLLNKYLDIVATDVITGNGTLYLDGDEDKYPFDLFDKTTQKVKDDKKDEKFVPSEGDEGIQHEN